jgi:hypothetical protein
LLALLPMRRMVPITTSRPASPHIQRCPVPRRPTKCDGKTESYDYSSKRVGAGQTGERAVIHALTARKNGMPAGCVCQSTKKTGLVLLASGLVPPFLPMNRAPQQYAVSIAPSVRIHTNRVEIVFRIGVEGYEAMTSVRLPQPASGCSPRQ